MAGRSKSRGRSPKRAASPKRTTKKAKRTLSPALKTWIKEVKALADAKGITYGEAMKLASKNRKRR